MDKKPYWFFILPISLLAASCASNNFKTGKPWDPNETPFFDDGVDVVEDMAKLSGKWAWEQEKDLDGRVQLADMVAKVEVISVQTSSDFEVENGKRIEVRVTEVVYGDSPGSKITLTSLRETPGHELIVRYESRLLGTYFLFARWFKGEAESLGHHFHLSPASEQMESEIKRRLNLRKRAEEEAAHKAARSR